MELLPLNSFAINSATSNLIDDVDGLAERVNGFRPFASELVAAVHEKLFAERVYSSNAIEGNTLTLRETVEVLKTGYIGGRRKREGTEARNLGEAVKHLESVLLRDDAPHSTAKLLHLHGILLKDIVPEAGVLRTDRRMITGATYQPPRPELVPELVRELLAALSAVTDVHPVVMATWAHWALARVHPFVDGNGRIARLWQDLVLLRAKLSPAIIRLQDRDQNGYYDALSAADGGDLNLLAQLIAQRVASTLEQYIAAQQQSAELTDWASRIAGEAAVRAAEQRKANYLRWSRVMESLRNDFQRCAAKITSSGIEVQFRAYPLIEEVAWENIRVGIGAKQTWFFSLSFRDDGRPLRYIFFLGKHFWTPFDNDREHSEPRVALLISEQSGQDDARMLGDIPGCPITLRELFAVDSDIVAVRCAPGTDGEPTTEYDRDSSQVKLAQEFIEQVLFRRIL